MSFTVAVPSTKALAALLDRCESFERFALSLPNPKRYRDAQPGLDQNTVAKLHIELALVALRELDIACQQHKITGHPHVG